MDRFKFVFLLICIVLTMFNLNRLNNIEKNNVFGVYGQADLGITCDISKSKIHNNANWKYLYSGSINIIEKYFTIYMILYILRYYIKSSYIRV